jgi:hypothetical protein
MKSIIFDSVEIKNFLSIGNDPVVVNFKTGLNIVTGKNLDQEDRQNGIGKCVDYSTNIDIEIEDAMVLEKYNLFLKNK